MKRKFLMWGLLLSCLALACTPKAGESLEEAPEQTAEPTPEPPEEDLSPCPKFRDAPDPDDAETNYVLYRDFCGPESGNGLLNCGKRYTKLLLLPMAAAIRSTPTASAFTNTK